MYIHTCIYTQHPYTYVYTYTYIYAHTYMCRRRRTGQWRGVVHMTAQKQGKKKTCFQKKKTDVGEEGEVDVIGCVLRRR